MESSIEKSVISPTLVGRAEQLESIRRQLEQAHGGQGRVVLATGEAGVGKTRLVGEAKALATRLEFILLQGNCHEPERSLPYAPLLDLMRLFFARNSPQELELDISPWAFELADLLPEFAIRLPDLPPPPVLDPQQKKYRLFHALEGFFFQLTTQKPLLLIVEDIHWSDDTSLDFLLQLARRLVSWPLMLLLTYRSEEENPSLGRFLARLDHARLAHEIPLAPLTPAEVDAMLRAIFELNRPVSSEFLNAIYDLTEGNPFFVEEVLKSLLASGDIFYRKRGWDRNPIDQLHIPRSVRVAVQQRADRLDPMARQVLTLAAIVGKHFDFSLLQALTGLEDQALLRQLKELMKAQLIVEESADQFAFRHALTREAVYASLLARERREYHRLIAENLERLFADQLDTHVSNLAYHYYQAGVWEKALDFSQQAGDKAQSLYAPREAYEWFTRALDAARQMGLPAPIQLYQARGQAYETLGEFERARLDYEQAFEGAKLAEDRESEWQSLINLGFLWVSKDYKNAGKYFHQALTLARTLGDASILAHSLNRLGNWYLNIEQTFKAIQHHLEALAIFEDQQDNHGLAETLDLLGMASYVSGDVIQGSTYLERAATLFRELDVLPGLVSSLATRTTRAGFYEGDVVVAAPNSPTIHDEAEMALKIAREIEYRPGEVYIRLGYAQRLGIQGDYARGLEWAQAGLEIAEEIQHSQWITFADFTLGALYLDLLALPRARRYLEKSLRLAHEINSNLWIRLASGFLASTCVLQYDLARAESVLNSALSLNAPIESIAQRQCWAARAELALARKDAAMALEITERLLALAPNLAEGRVIPRLSRLRGEALAALSQWDEAEVELRAGCAGAIALGMRPMLWRLHLTLGKLYRARRLFEAAEREFSAARALIEELSDTVPDKDLARNFLQTAFAMLPRSRSSSPRRAAKLAYGGLTEREREVATLVAQGRSNREIAEALTLSVRTVERHISNILNKLGYRSRAQIIAWALEKDLAQVQQE